MRSATDFLPFEHEPVDELRDEHRAVDGVGLDLAWLDLGAAGHPSYAFFAPYFERAWRRSETPAESSPPRMTL